MRWLTIFSLMLFHASAVATECHIIEEERPVSLQGDRHEMVHMTCPAKDINVIVSKAQQTDLGNCFYLVAPYKQFTKMDSDKIAEDVFTHWFSRQTNGACLDYFGDTAFPVGSIHKGHEREKIFIAAQRVVQALKAGGDQSEAALSSVSFFEYFFNSGVYEEFDSLLNSSTPQKQIRVETVHNAVEYPYYYLVISTKDMEKVWLVELFYENGEMSIVSVSKAII